jgi:hypothetical protein
MTQDEFITWLKDFINSHDREGDSDYLIWVINGKLSEVEGSAHPFCGGTWNAGSFDYYWTPNDYE